MRLPSTALVPALDRFPDSASIAPARRWMPGPLKPFLTNHSVWSWATGLLVWAGFSVWLVWGYPPCVDLPAHAAQLETLDALLRGHAAVSSVYTWHFAVGYGLVYLLGLPLAHIWNGAVAARALLWCALVLHPVSWAVLLRALGRSFGVLLCLLPFAFCISYWYGFLPFYFTEPLLFFGLALFLRTLSKPTVAQIAAINAFACLVAQSHLVMLAVLLALSGCAALVRTRLTRAVTLILASFAIPLLMFAPRVWTLFHRALSPGALLPTEYAAMSHLNWFFKNYRPEGRLIAVYPVFVAALFVVFRFFRRHRESPTTLALFAGMAVLYAVTPKTLSGVWGVSIRFACLAGTLSVALVDWRSLPRSLRAVLVGLSLVSVGETAVFHGRFARAVDGLDTMIAAASGRADGALSMVGNRILGSKHIYLEHVGAWVTATRGGIGHNFLEGADEEPVEPRVPGVPPTDLSHASAEQLAMFDTVLVFGPGPFPEALSRWPVLATVGAWTLLGRP
jgi:hypothetical protein